MNKKMQFVVDRQRIRIFIPTNLRIYRRRGPIESASSNIVHSYYQADTIFLGLILDDKDAYHTPQAKDFISIKKEKQRGPSQQA
ncbi:MAG: hypothetical protein K5930_01355 [Treponemataceae bacterium]|nr:hypothetical protein [Treponemataceae bacterium]